MPTRPKRALVTRLSFGTRHMVRVALDKANPPMADVDQLRRHVVRGLHIIHEYRAGKRMVGAGRNAHEGNVERLKRVQHGHAIGDGGGQYRAINMRLPDHAAHLFADIGVGHIHWLGNQAHAFFMATVPAALHDLVHIIRAVIVVDQRNLAGLGARQYARGNAWAKTAAPPSRRRPWPWFLR